MRKEDISVKKLMSNLDFVYLSIITLLFNFQYWYQGNRVLVGNYYRAIYCSIQI